jgi:acyl-CoA thioesterase FadM
VRDGDELEIGVRPLSVGTKSFQLEYVVRSGNTVAAEAKTVIVSYDYESGGSVELPETWKEALAA